MILKKSAPKVNQNVLVTAAIISTIGIFLLLRDFFILITFAAILAYLFNPVYKWSLKKFKNKEGRAVTLTVLVLFVTFTIPLTLLLIITVSQAAILLDNIEAATSAGGSFTETIDILVDQFNQQASRLPFMNDQSLSSEEVAAWIKDSASIIISTAVDIATSLAGGIANFFTMLIIFLFVFSSFLKNQKMIVNTLNDINPLGITLNQMYLKKMGDMTTAMVKGQFAIALAQGLSGTISLWIIGIDYLAFWFVLLTFLSIIPLGGGIILIPMGIILILTGNVWQGVLLLAWHFIITTNIDNIMRPKFVPKSARLDPALTILSVFAGIGIFGFLGIVIGPVILIVFLSTLDVYLDYRRGLISK